MSISPKNAQGFTVFSTDFDGNYGKPIFACFQFEFMGFEISVSTGACKPSSDMYPVSLSPILITNIKTGAEVDINGSVQDAINYVLQQTSIQEAPVAMLESDEAEEVSVKMKRFGGTEGAADSLYNNPSYDDGFKVETTSGDIVNVTLGWEQGHGNNYRFYADNSDERYYLPDEIAKVEVL